MRPPLKKRIGLPETPHLEPMPTTDSKTEALEEKRQLAKHLHNQAINPVRWTEAHPASQSDQQTFQATGQKPRGNQFDVKGKLYNWSPNVTATPQQAKAITDAYMAERSGTAPRETSPAIHEMVEIEKVPLSPPFGTPHKNRPANDLANDMSATEERRALFRHYAQSGVDPDKAHLGDPLPMKDQERLKAEIKKISSGASDPIKAPDFGKAPHADEIAQSHSLPLFYQGFDDKWIYQTNSHTRESDEVQKLRAEHLGANENNAVNDDVIDKIVTHYEARFPRLEGNTPSELMRRYKSAVQNLPEMADVIDSLQAGKPLTEQQKKVVERTTATLNRAGIKFDYRVVDAEFLRALQSAEKKDISSLDTSDPEKIEAAAALFGLRVSEALAGGRFDVVRMQQAGSASARIGLALESYLARFGIPAKSVATLFNAEAAKEGPIDYDAAVNEMSALLSDIGLLSPDETSTTSDRATAIGSVSNRQEFKPASVQTIQSLSSSLADVSNIEIFIGGIPLFKQSEHKTLMDEIFRTEFIKVAQEKGCLPSPEDEWNSHGGSKPQKRITDVDQRGHLGSRQPDGWVRWKNPDNSWTEVLWNSTSTLADGFTDTAREVKALNDIIVKADKQVAMAKAPIKFTDNPVKGNPKILSMGEKPNWSEAELRKYISKKVRDFFDKNFEDCRFIGENRIEKADDVHDPDLPSTPPR